MPAIFLILFVIAGSLSPDAVSVDRAWTILRDGLDSKTAAKRQKAVHALALLQRNARAREWAENALADSNADVRAEAADSLGAMDAQSSRAKLRKALNDNEIKVALAAANALYTLKDPAAYEVFYSILTGERKSSAGLVQSQLNTLKDPKAMEKLAFQTGIGFVPFGGMTYEAWKTVTHDDTSPIRAAAAEKLARDPDPKSRAALETACSDRKWQVRAASAVAIAKRGDPRLARAVIPLLMDDNDTVRNEGAAAVIRLSRGVFGASGNAGSR